jgi:hypothetical protein
MHALDLFFVQVLATAFCDVCDILQLRINFQCQKSPIAVVLNVYKLCYISFIIIDLLMCLIYHHLSYLNNCS